MIDNTIYFHPKYSYNPHKLNLTQPYQPLTYTCNTSTYSPNPKFIHTIRFFVLSIKNNLSLYNSILLIIRYELSQSRKSHRFSHRRYHYPHSAEERKCTDICCAAFGIGFTLLLIILALSLKNISSHLLT